MRSAFFLAVVFGVPCLAEEVAGQTPFITEFQASNQVTLVTGTDDTPDWIELYNPGATAIQLEGWTLTDNSEALAKWAFPQVLLGPGKFLVVYASGRDLRDPAAALHTNFKMETNGEFLALVSPSGQVATSFAPKYPAQLPDITYGLGMTTQTGVLVPTGAEARYFVPPDNTLDAEWFLKDFDDAAWTRGPTGLGYDRKTEPTFTAAIQTDVSAALDGVNSSIFVRIRFQATAADVRRLLTIRAQYDDGYVAFLNGQEVARQGFGASSTLRYNSRATRQRSNDEALSFEDVNLTLPDALLVEGENVLAIQGLNNTSTGDDFLLVPQLLTTEVVSVAESTKLFFAQPTPGRPNGVGFAAIAEPPSFSHLGGAYTAPPSVTLTGPTPESVVRYTINGTEPTDASDPFTTPIEVTTALRIKAKTFLPGLLPSKTVSESYFLLNGNVVEFTSQLPIVVMNSFGKTPNESAYTPVQLMLIDRDPMTGLAKITDAPSTSVGAALKTRGSSTAGTPKPSWSMETRDDLGEDKQVKLLDMPKESDWVLHAPYSFDPALVRNAFIYDLSNQVGRYAVRTRFVEVFLNIPNAPLSRTTSYYGVYSLMEKIKQGPDRVDVEEMLPESTTEPDIAGGYMLKIDRLDPGDAGISAAGQRMGLVYPKEREITAVQSTWIRNYFDAFLRALNSPNFRDPVNGYLPYVDVDSWIDHHILNVLAMNVDALRLSTYFFKRRAGKIEFGPIWDFDRSMGSTDGRDDNPRAWKGTGDATDFFNYPWWGRLFQDPDFYAKYRARWRELRGGPLSTENMFKTIDGMANEIGVDAATRNFQKWSVIAPSAWPAQLSTMKTWLSTRASWIDGEFVEAPSFSIEPGEVLSGAQLGLSVSSGEIFYTLNGPDPLAAGNKPAAEAVPYSAPITLTQNTRVRARARVAANVWSALTEGTFVTDLLPVVITELSYHPQDPEVGSPYRASDFEFLEIQNIGAKVADLTGVKVGARPAFDFTGSDLTTLEPGAFALVVRNVEAFVSRYGEGLPIAGILQSTATFSDSTQLVSLTGPLDETLSTFKYDDDWYPETDGGGYTLVIRDAQGPRSAWETQEAWRASIEVGGSPGRADLAREGLQLPGDITQDGTLNLTDPVALLRHLFQGFPQSPCSSDEANRTLFDTDGNQQVDLTDAIRTLRFLFLGDAPPVLGTQCVEIPGCPSVCR